MDVLKTPENFDSKHIVHKVLVLPISVLVVLFILQSVFQTPYASLRLAWANGIADLGCWLSHEGYLCKSVILTSEVAKSILLIRYQLVSVLVLYIFLFHRRAGRYFWPVVWLITIQAINCLRVIAIEYGQQMSAPGQLVFQLLLILAPAGLALADRSPRGLWFALLARLPDANQVFYKRIFMALLGLVVIRTIWYFIGLADSPKPTSSWWSNIQFIAEIQALTDHILSAVILFFTWLMVNIYGYTAIFDGLGISNGISYVGLGPSCIGKSIMVVFSIVVLVSRGKWTHKALYLLSGLVVLLLLNGIRLGLLFVYIDQFGVSAYNYDKWHSIYSMFVYLAVMALWWGYYKVFTRS